MLTTIILSFILFFLVIIAIQNSTRGGMQNDNLNRLIDIVTNMRGGLEYLTIRQTILDRDNNFDLSKITEANNIHKKR